jgi:phosphoglycolate phosphatase-like HAD superfamily hydrolase
MADKIVVMDFAGTLIRAEIIEEANQFRAKVLRRSLPTSKEHSRPDKLYKVNNEFVEKLTGLAKDMKIRYRENNLDFIDISGEKYQNQISTNLFQIGMYMAAKKYGKGIMPEGMLAQLQRIKKLDYKLAIVSGVRTDTISGMLMIAGIPTDFDYIFAQPPILGVSNQENLESLKKNGSIAFVIGDKLSDLEAGKGIGAKTIFVSWGHASGGENEFADYTINEPKELEKIIL